MPIEAALTRELEIRFIDARNLVSEAKMKLGIIGYTCDTQEAELLQVATQLFHEQTDDKKSAMRRMKMSLDAVKTQRQSSISETSKTDSDSRSGDDNDEWDEFFGENVSEDGIHAPVEDGDAKNRKRNKFLGIRAWKGLPRNTTS